MVGLSSRTDESISDERLLKSNLQTYHHAAQRYARECSLAEGRDRAFFVEKLREGLERRARACPSFSLLFVYIQRVTLRNDMYGLPTDSHVMEAVATKLRRQIRAVDSLIRAGEQGLVVFLHHASPAGASAVAARLQSTIDRADFFYESVAFQVKITVSVAPVHTEDTAETLLARVNRFLLE